MRHLILDATGLAIPAVSLAALLLNGWVRSAALVAWYSRTQLALRPVDFIPALYCDGMSETTHGYYALLAGGVGVLCLYEPLLALVASLVARFGRRVHIIALLTFSVLVVLAYLGAIVMVIVGLLQGLACSLTDRWGCGLTALDKAYMPSKPGPDTTSDLVVILTDCFVLPPVLTIFGILLMPVAALWYFLRG